MSSGSKPLINYFYTSEMDGRKIHMPTLQVEIKYNQVYNLYVNKKKQVFTVKSGVLLPTLQYFHAILQC
jgi:hypothetical protein